MVVSWSIFIGLMYALGSYLVMCFVALVDSIWGGDSLGIRMLTGWRRRARRTMKMGAALSFGGIPMAAVVALASPVDWQAVWWIVLLSELSPLILCYWALFGWSLPRRPQPPGIEWSAWVYYNPKHNYQLENGR